MNLFGVISLLFSILVGALLVLSKKLRFAGLALLVCAAVFAGWQWQKEKRWSRGFEAVRDGVVEEKVIKTLGRPTFRADSATPPFGYSLSDRNKLVKSEIWYVSFYLPEQFAFGFDERRILIDRYHYASP